MTLRNSSLLGTRLLALFLIVTGLVALPGSIDAILLRHDGFLFNAESFFRLAGGVIVWLAAKPLALSAELAGIELDRGLLTLPEDGTDPAGAMPVAPPDPELSQRRSIVVAGSVLLGLHVLVVAIPGLVSRVYNVIAIPHSSPADGGLFGKIVVSAVVGAIQVAIGVGFVAGRTRVADVVERLRYRQTEAPTDEHGNE